MKRQSKLLSTLAVAFILGVGCAPSRAHTPSNIAGSIPLTVANNQPPGNSVCALLMLPPGSTKIDNMLGKTHLAPGEQAHFSVAAGTYKLGMSDCKISGDQGNSQKGSVMSAIAGKIDGLNISGPTYVSIGARPSSPPAGYTVRTLAPGVQETAVCSPEGEQCDANTNCCSGAQCRAGRCP